MSIDRMRAHYGFERMPFGKDLVPGMLHPHRAHQQAVARISWCVAERQIGVISGECGSGKTVAARAAVQALDCSRHTILYLGTPGVGLRGLYAAIVCGLGGTPEVSLRVADPASPRPARRRSRGALKAGVPHRRRGPSTRRRQPRRAALPAETPTWTRLPRSRCFCSDSRRCAAGYGSAHSPRWTSASACATRSPASRPSETASYIAHHLKLAGRFGHVVLRRCRRA